MEDVRARDAKRTERRMDHLIRARCLNESGRSPRLGKTSTSENGSTSQTRKHSPLAQNGIGGCSSTATIMAAVSGRINNVTTMTQTAIYVRSYTCQSRTKLLVFAMKTKKPFPLRLRRIEIPFRTSIPQDSPTPRMAMPMPRPSGPTMHHS